MKDRFIIGSRGSELALWQANYVRSRLERFFPDVRFEIKIISTTGDRVLEVALSKVGDKGLFTRQIESELLDGQIDLAVHSLKDLQTEQPDGLVIGAVCPRELPNDALISRTGLPIDKLPVGARVATGSLRRRSQLLGYRPDIAVEEIRGNVPSRLRKFDESDLDAMILAYAGLRRLGLDRRISHLIPFEIMLPAVGQGAVAVEVRRDDREMREVGRKLDDPPTRTAVTAERAFLRRLEGGCQVPIGAYAQLAGETLELEGMVGSLDGTIMFRERVSGDAKLAEELGVRLAERLIEKGAGDVLADARRDAGGLTEAVL